MSGWRWNRRKAAVIVACVLAIQVAIPLGLLILRPDDYPGRFGWQMYSNSSQAAAYTVHTESGTEEIAASRYMTVPRLDLPLEELLPPHFCEVVEGAIRVTWDSGEHQC